MRLENLQKIESGTLVGSQAQEICLFHLVFQREMPLCFLHADGLADNKFSFFSFWQAIPGVSTVCNAFWPSGDWVVPSIFLETPQTIVFIRGLQSFVVGCFVFYLFSFPCPSCFCFNSIGGKVKVFVASVNLAHLSSWQRQKSEWVEQRCTGQLGFHPASREVAGWQCGCSQVKWARWSR